MIFKPPYQEAKAAPAINKQVVVTAKANKASTDKQQQPQPIVKTEATQPEAPPVVQPPAVFHSDDFYMEYIFQHESSGNPHATNAIGCVGLGQACPASKLLSICPDLGDVACQVRFFTNYAVTRYGSWSNAYQFWVGNGWW